MKTIVLLMLALVTCSGATKATEEFERKFGDSNILVTEDTKRGVVCYSISQGISCVKVSP